MIDDFANLQIALVKYCFNYFSLQEKCTSIYKIFYIFLDEWDDDAFSNMNDSELNLLCDSINRAQIIVYEKDTLSKLVDYQGTNLNVEKMKLLFHWNKIQATSLACKFKEESMVFIAKNSNNENYYLFGKTRNSETPVLLAVVTQYLKFERHENSSFYFRENMIDLHFSKYLHFIK